MDWLQHVPMRPPVDDRRKAKLVGKTCDDNFLLERQTIAFTHVDDLEVVDAVGNAVDAVSFKRQKLNFKDSLINNNNNFNSISQHDLKEITFMTAYCVI